MSPPLEASARSRRPEVTTDGLALFLAVWFALCCNLPFWRLATEGRLWTEPGTWRFVVGTGVALVALNYALLALWLHRLWARIGLTVVALLAALAVYWLDTWQQTLDWPTLRTLTTTPLEELRSRWLPALAMPLLLYAGVPLLAIWLVRLRDRRWERALPLRVGGLLFAALVGSAAVLIVGDDLRDLQHRQPRIAAMLVPATTAWRLAATPFGPTPGAATGAGVASGADSGTLPRRAVRSASR